jgi:hypothetical protein
MRSVELMAMCKSLPVTRRERRAETAYGRERVVNDPAKQARKQASKQGKTDSDA